MPIPIEKGHRDKIDRELRRLQAERTDAVKDCERLLYKALQASIAADHGAAGASERVFMLIDAAEDRGLAKGALKRGGGMTGKLLALLGGTPSQALTAALLYEASDMLVQANRQADADAVLAIADKTASRKNAADFAEATRPVKRVPF